MENGNLETIKHKCTTKDDFPRTTLKFFIT